MLTKEEFIKRPGDVDLGWVFNDMRRAQRERDWPYYWMNMKAANANTPPRLDYVSVSLMEALMGKGF